MSSPAPIVVEPTGDFIGIDGKWSAFEVEVGEPPQKIKVLPSTEISQTLVVVPEGCTDEDAKNCTEARGGAYDKEKSKNWTFKNNYDLNIEVNLGMVTNSDRGEFGYDTISLPAANEENVTLDSQLLSGVATKDFFVGSLGLSQTPLSFQSTGGGAPDTRPSLITSLKNANLIPSLSYGFTAGASYRDSPASLTIGGYDASRFEANDISIGLASNPLRQLLVGLNSITFSDSENDKTSLLPNGILTLVDSTIPDIWLPLEACRLFESAFGISYDPIASKYLVNNTVHNNLVKQNASITFGVGIRVGEGPTVEITIPYTAFDLDLGTGYPGVKKLPNKYFPLRQAADDTSYTLGRTFMQEAFIIVDYGSNNFSISKAIHSSSSPNIVPIAASNVTGTQATATGTTPANTGPAIVKTVTKGSSFPVGAIAGIVVALVLITLAVIGFFFWRKRKSKSSNDSTPELATDAAYPPNHKELHDTTRSSSTEKKEAVEISTPHHLAPGFPELAGETPRSEHPPRSELSSPEPITRQNSPEPISYPFPAAELSSRDPQWSYTELASPQLSSGHPSPPLDAQSGPSSPRWPRPPMHNRRSALDRVSTTTSDTNSTALPIQGGVQRNTSNSSTRSGYGKDGAPLRPPHDRKGSDDSGFSHDTFPRRPSQLRKDSHDSGFTVDTLPASRPAHYRTDSRDSDPLRSPKLIPYAHRPGVSRRESTTVESRMEQNNLAEFSEPETDAESHLMEGDEGEMAEVQVVRRTSGATLISQASPPGSPKKVTTPSPTMPTMPSISRKEVPNSSAAAAHSRTDSGSTVGPESVLLGGSAVGAHGRHRSTSSGSRFEEKFEEGRKS